MSHARPLSALALVPHGVSRSCVVHSDFVWMPLTRLEGDVISHLSSVMRGRLETRIVGNSSIKAIFYSRLSKGRWQPRVETTKIKFIAIHVPESFYVIIDVRRSQNWSYVCDDSIDLQKLLPDLKKASQQSHLLAGIIVSIRPNLCRILRGAISSLNH